MMMWQRTGVCGQVYILSKVDEAQVWLDEGIRSRCAGGLGNQVTGKEGKSEVNRDKFIFRM